MRKGKKRRVCKKEIREKGTVQREKDNNKKTPWDGQSKQGKSPMWNRGLEKQSRSTTDYERKSGLPKEI